MIIKESIKEQKSLGRLTKIKKKEEIMENQKSKFQSGGVMMKRYALISFLLLVVFMWNCENKSSSAYAPEAYKVENLTLQVVH